MCCNCQYDVYPEGAFYMVGDIAEVGRKAEQMAKDLAAGDEKK